MPAYEYWLAKLIVLWMANWCGCCGGDRKQKPPVVDYGLEEESDLEAEIISDFTLPSEIYETQRLEDIKHYVLSEDEWEDVDKQD